MKNSIIALVFIGFFMTSCQQDNNNRTFDPAFTHTVYFWFNEPNNKEHQAKFETSLKNFLDNSKYAKTNFIGTAPKATREVVDGSFTYALILTFESAQAQENYQNEKVHLQFIDECKDLWEKVIVYDANGI